MTYLLLIIGFVLLVKGADYFVEGASSIARNLRIPSIIIGLTIVAFGTSAPEAAVSITAALRGSNDIALGNIIGSNIFNLLVVIGMSALIKPLKVSPSMIRKDFPFSIVAAIVLLVIAFDTVLGGQAAMTLSQGDGIILLIFFGIFMYTMITEALKARQVEVEEQTSRQPLWKSSILAIVGLVGIVAGGNFVVNSATDIARNFGLSENLIGLTIVAIGTSLPELVTSIVAAKKGKSDIALGNVVGSNLFNIFFVLGASALIHPIAVSILSIFDLAILIGVSVLLYLVIVKQQCVKKWFGVSMLLAYGAYTFYIIVR